MKLNFNGIKSWVNNLYDDVRGYGNKENPIKVFNAKELISVIPAVADCLKAQFELTNYPIVHIKCLLDVRIEMFYASAGNKPVFKIFYNVDSPDSKSLCIYYSKVLKNNCEVTEAPETFNTTSQVIDAEA